MTQQTETMTRDQKAMKTRLEILDAAKAVFDREGYAEATIRKIAAEAGKSTGSVFFNWDTKKDLFFQVYGHWPLDGDFAKRAMAIITCHGNDRYDLEKELGDLQTDLQDRKHFEKVTV